jgi:hypothetical protein
MKERRGALSRLLTGTVILATMVRPLSAWVLASVLVGTPVATALCGVVCQTHQTHEMRAMAGHAHHSHGGVHTSGATLMSGPYGCEHPSAGLVAVQQVLQGFAAPAIAAVQPFVPLPDASVLVARSSDIEHSPPGSFALIAQLRV